MKAIKIPKSYNYIGIFLTFACNLKCSYCINNFRSPIEMRGNISGKDWVSMLNRIESRPDLPVTLQGGEPTTHPDFIYIVNNLKPELNIDILTNLQFDIDTFMRKVDPERIKRRAPYASIRVSYHPETMDLDDTLERAMKMMKAGYSIGIWSVAHPAYAAHIKTAQRRAEGLGIDFRTKEFLGEYKGEAYGTYKYPGACNEESKRKVLCKTTELLADSQANIYRCHYELYKGINSIGTLYDPDFQIEDVYRDCGLYGRCNPCDVKLKTNRFQIFGHASVDIKTA